jgi:hypothetical protein
VGASPLPAGQNLDQYGHNVDQSVRAMFASYLALGPLYWLVLLLVLWAVAKILGKFGGFILLFLKPTGKD